MKTSSCLLILLFMRVTASVAPSHINFFSVYLSVYPYCLSKANSILELRQSIGPMKAGSELSAELFKETEQLSLRLLHHLSHN